MKHIIVLFSIILCLTACEESTTTTKETGEAPDTTAPVKDTAAVDIKKDEGVFDNERFRNLTVNALSKETYEISGQAQVFEAAFSWVIEDGHNELQEGHEMTDAGAPEWGNFKFKVDVGKYPENATLHIILYEASAMDGSRQHQLPVPLK